MHSRPFKGQTEEVNYNNYERQGRKAEGIWQEQAKDKEKPTWSSIWSIILHPPNELQEPTTQRFPIKTLKNQTYLFAIRGLGGQICPLKKGCCKIF